MKRAPSALAACALATAAATASAEPFRDPAERASDGAASSCAPGDCFLDLAGRERSFSSTYEDWSPQARRKPRYARAAVEMVALLGLGTAYYWLRPRENVVDWDFPHFYERLNTKAVRFDNNLHRTNHLLHAGSGSMYYWLSRVNGLGVPASLGYSTVASGLFEYTLEWLEKVSINDLIYTPAAGFAAGEVFFQLSSYLASAPSGGSWGHVAASRTLGLPVWAHDAADGLPPPRPLPPDSLGFSSAYWHRFGLGYAASAVENDEGRSGALAGFRLETDVVLMPGFLRPGTFSKWFHEGNFSESRVAVDVADGRLADVDVWFHSHLAGHYEQEIGVGARPRGHATMLGASTAMRYVDRWLLGRRDHWGIAHLIGPAITWWRLEGGIQVRLEGDVHADFAAPRALAYAEWSERGDPAGVKSVLQRQGYAFAFGGSARGRVTLEVEDVRVDGRAWYGRYESVEGLDRVEERVSRDVHSRDEILEMEASLTVAPEVAPVYFGLSIDQTTRRGRMAPAGGGDPTADVTRHDRRLTFGAGLVL